MSAPAKNNTLELIAMAQAGDSSACEKIMVENSALVWSIARRFFGRGIEPDDLYQIGSLGLLKAVQGFDLSYGTQFSTYAVPKIIGEIRRFLRDDGFIKVSRSTKDNAAKIAAARNKLENELGREPFISEISNETGIPAEDIAVCDNVSAGALSLQGETMDGNLTLLDLVSCETEIEDEIIDKIVLKDAIKALPERERIVIYLRFFKGLTQVNVANVLKVSQVQISRLEQKAFKHLKKMLF